MTFQIRPLSPADYPRVISVIDQWWGGRPMAGKLPRLFFEHFTDTSFAAGRDGRLAGFLAGFISQSRPGEAYIHFVGVDPAERGGGLGRLLYEAFFRAAEARGCGLVRAVTSPVNRGSVAFHQRMGFQLALLPRWRFCGRDRAGGFILLTVGVVGGRHGAASGHIG